MLSCVCLLLRNIYQPNAVTGELVEKIDGIFALIWAVWSSEEVLEKSGCDAYLFLQTIKGCFKTCLYATPFAIITLIVYATGDVTHNFVNKPATNSLTSGVFIFMEFYQFDISLQNIFDVCCKYFVIEINECYK